MIVAGVMSGTSLDGVDVAVCDITLQGDCVLQVRILGYQEHPFPGDLASRVPAVLAAGQASLAELTALNTALGRAFAAAVNGAMDALDLPPTSLDLVASHGQTIYHLTEGERGTWQMGEPAVIAAETGATVISDFRAADMARGGEGAPLVPFVDALLFTRAGRTRAVQNLGGIGNVTFLPAAGEPYAFDTGPGNMVVDHLARALLDSPYDRDGEAAASGQIHKDLLEELLAHPFFHRPPPKSTGRELFGAAYGDELIRCARERDLSTPDALATATALTAESMARAYRAFGPERIDEIVVSGGGARNGTLMRMIAERLPEARVLLSSELGMPVDAKEAIAFAALGYETIHGRPGTLPRCTGARESVMVGKITPGRNFVRLMRESMEQACQEIRSVRLAL